MPLNNPPSQTPMTSSDGGVLPMWRLWFDSIKRIAAPLNNDGSFAPATLLDVDASNNSVYYSTDSGKLVYKDSGGTVNELY